MNVNNFKQRYLKDTYIFLLLGVAIVAVGVFGFRKHEYQVEQNEDEIASFEDAMPLKCEHGEWVEFPDLDNAADHERFIGKERLSYDEGADAFFSKGDAYLFDTDTQYSLFFFVDRDIEVDGYKIGDNKIYVRRARCVGEESNMDIVQERRKLMNYINDNINALALEGSASGDWQVHAFYFVNNTDLYVQYETEASFIEEAPYDSHLWLIRTAQWSGDIPVIETLAYIQEDASDYEKNIVKQGEDIYKNVQNMTIYEFDDEVGQWVLQ